MSDKNKLLKDSIKSLRSAIDDWQELESSDAPISASPAADKDDNKASKKPLENNITSPELMNELRKQLEDLS